MSGLAESGQEVADIPFIASPPGTSALGGGLRFSASPYRAPDNDEIREYDLVPLYLYNGKYVFFRGTSGGLHLVHNDRFELNLLGRYQFLKLDPDRNSFYDGINEREQTLEAGIQIASYNPWGVIRLEWLADTLDRHGGNTVNLSYRYVTFAKLLTDGPRVDFWGKGSVYRHFESDEGNGNFLSYTLYIMAMGTGYLPWTEQESFRWGFGFGMSYADKVPIAEQRKQAAKGNNTSRFINYLELQLDFPLRRVFKQTAWLRNCYAGFTVVHRSGIFGTSDILGDVSGGSDWITAHFECTRGGR